MTPPSRAPARPAVGAMEWFVKGEHARVERVVASLRALGVRHLRTGLSWAEWHSEGGAAWYDTLLPRLARDFEILPCVTYTPPSLGITPSVTSPPRRTRDYADFLDMVVDRYGEHFRYVELWNEPNNLSDWDWRLDTDWSAFAAMIADAASWMRHRGKRPVLAGMSPADARWLRVMGEHGVLHLFDAVGVHGFPETWEPHWRGWTHVVAEMRAVLDHYAPTADVWITEVGSSTWRGDEHSQLRELAAALAAPVGRVYVYCAEDLDPARPTNDGLHADERDYHFGLARADGTPKLLWRIWRGHGLDGVLRAARLCDAPPRRSYSGAHVVVTGGGGAAGARVAERLLLKGRRVVVLDDLSAPGAADNLLRLRARYGARLEVDVADVRDPAAVRRTVRGATGVYHLLDEPEGALVLLEEARRRRDPPPVLFRAA